jgi:nitroreductase
MEFYEVINKRHSIREFERKQIPKSKILKIIKAASKAPSGANTQPWKFYVIQNKNKRDKIAQILRDYYNLTSYKNRLKNHKFREIMQNFYSNMGNAPCCIFIYYKKIKGYPDPVLNASATLASENLMLAATAESLGTCWINAFAHKPKKVNKLLKIPKDEILIAPLIIGYPKKGYEYLKREKRNLNEIMRVI